MQQLEQPRRCIPSLTPPRGEQVHTFDYVNMAICKTVGYRAKSASSITGRCPRPCAPLPGLAAALQRGPARRPHSHAHLSHYSAPILMPFQVATVTRSKAHRITVAAHTNNLAVVTTTWKQMAKTYCIKLQKFGLTSSIAPGDGGGDDGGSDGPETQ